MITKDIKISKLLSEYPQALEVLLNASKDFHKLKNPILRRFLAPRVTIEQAAKIGAVQLHSLLSALNAACGFTYDEKKDVGTSTTFRPQPKPDIISKTADNKIVLLDVRDDIRQKTDPFKKIIGTVKQLKKDQILHLINIFEPVPLYDVLSHRGLDHWTENIGKEWHVYFYHDESLSSQSESIDDRTGQAAEENIIELNVEGLEPPEPMMKILEALVHIDENTSLLVHHHREPMMLYEKLEERGFEWITTKLDENHYRIMIRMKKEN